MEIKAADVKALRDITGLGMMDCKNALIEAKGDIEKAKQILKERGVKIAQKKSGRTAKEGIIEAYVHPGNRIGVLLEVNCETDFVARNSDFRSFVHDVALQIAARSPRFVKKEDVEAEVAQSGPVAEEVGPTAAAISGDEAASLEEYYREVCLLEQPFIKDESKTVGDLLVEMMAKLGERIEIRRFARYELGEDSEGRTAT